jgi:hypothetical protein
MEPWLKLSIPMTIYSFCYGMFEYFFLHKFYYDYVSRLSYKYWIIMWFFPIFISFIILKRDFNISLLFFVIHLFGLVEDISYFIAYGINHSIYPYPVSDWYDSTIGSFELFHLGRPINIFPYMPIFYFYYAMVIIIYICLFNLNKQSYLNIFNIFIIPTTLCQIFLPPKWSVFLPVWLIGTICLIVMYKKKYFINLFNCSNHNLTDHNLSDHNLSDPNPNQTVIQLINNPLS